MTRSDSEEEETVVLTKEELSGAAAGGVNASTATLSKLIALELHKQDAELNESKESSPASQTSTALHGCS